MLQVRYKLGAAVAAVVIFFAGQIPANAAPIQLDALEFATEVNGLNVIVEDFNGYTAGEKASPFVTANGTYSSDRPAITDDGGACPHDNFCLSDFDQEGERIFSQLPGDATHWGATLGYFIETDLLDIVVTGNSGVLNLTGIELGGFAFGFFGVFDPLGLISISFRNNGTPLDNGTLIGNYSFDNVVTASAAPPVTVTEPASLILLSLGLAGLAFLRRQRTAVRVQPARIERDAVRSVA